ncbi:MAG: TatD family nuclease-associated radical SAM protein [Chromatiales bacterium]|nr:TatD family nuclease-associated radical SAM protein [Chromatiales bacterium]
MDTHQLSYQIDNRLYLNITDSCTLDCVFCPKTRGSCKVGDYDLTLGYRPKAEEIMACISQPEQYDEVVFCGYGEPTLRLNLVVEVAQVIKQQGGKVRVNTDGLANLVHKNNVLPKLATCVDILSISMNAQDADTYDSICQPGLPGSFEKMLEFVSEAPRYISDVRASAIDGIEGVDISACRKLAEQRGATFLVRTLDKIP